MSRPFSPHQIGNHRNSQVRMCCHVLLVFARWFCLNIFKLWAFGQVFDRSFHFSKFVGFGVKYNHECYWLIDWCSGWEYRAPCHRNLHGGPHQPRQRQHGAPQAFITRPTKVNICQGSIKFLIERGLLHVCIRGNIARYNVEIYFEL